MKPIDRTAIIIEALEALEVMPWRHTRYANDTGTCLWCDTGSLVMVPDDMALDWFCQATGAEELDARLRPEVEARISAAADAGEQAASVGGQSLSASEVALLEVGGRIRQEGLDEGLRRARVIFTRIMRGRFGELPAMVEQRIAVADFDQLERWSERVFSLPRAVLIVA